MLAESRMALASHAARTIVAAASTDAWEECSRGFARLLGRADLEQEQTMARHLEEARRQLARPESAGLERTRAILSERWTERLTDLLENYPSAEADLRALVGQVQAELTSLVLPAGRPALPDRVIVVGVDGSPTSLAALRWAAREAALRGASVLAVRAWEREVQEIPGIRATPGAGQPSPETDRSTALAELRESVRVTLSGQPGVTVEAELVDGLAARVLLNRCRGADMLVLGTGHHTPGELRVASPVILACLRRAPCPVVVISAAEIGAERTERAGGTEKAQGAERTERSAEFSVPVLAGVVAIGGSRRLAAGHGNIPATRFDQGGSPGRTARLGARPPSAWHALPSGPLPGRRSGRQAL